MLRRARQTGQALVEFALAATLIFFLLSASVDLGMILFAVQGLHNAAQEGAMYGSAMPFDDSTDVDKDGVTDHDIYNSKKEPGEFFPEFLAEVRKRASYEAGKRGGIGYVSLRDLNNDGVLDDEAMREQFIEVEVLDRQKGGDPCGDPDTSNVQCYIRVKISTIYKIQFPLAPALPNDQIVLSSEFTMPLNKSGFTRFGKPNTEPITATLTPTPTPSVSPTASPSPTPTPTPVVACTGYTSGDIASPWQQRRIGIAQGDAEVAVDGDDKATIKICGAAEQIYGKDDDFSFVYDERFGSDGLDQEFIGKIGEWLAPDKGNKDPSKAGLMIRRSDNPGSPFFLVGYRPDGSNNVFLNYRSTQGGTVQAVFAESASPPVWFRIMRTNRKVRAWYSTSDPPGTWTEIKEGSDPWMTVDGFDDDVIMYGVALASGYDPNPVGAADYADKFARTMFEQVEVTSLSLAGDIRFVTPNVDGLMLGQDEGVDPRDETNFETEITPPEDVDIDTVLYELFDPDGVLIWSDTRTSDPECAFGASGGACLPMSQSDFDTLLQKRGIDRYYTIRARVTFDDEYNTQRETERRFQLQNVFIEFVIPEDNGLFLTSVNATNFEINAYDPKVGTDPGDGIAHAQFWIGFTPTGMNDRDRIYLVDRTTDVLCVFGGEPGSGNNCDTMPDAVGQGFKVTVPAPEPPPTDPPNYNSLRAGEYIIYARVLPAGGDPNDPNHWSAIVSRSFNVEPPEFEFVVPDTDMKELPKVDQTKFEVKAWMPHVGTTNGDGVGMVAFQILEGDDPSNVLNEVIYSSSDITGGGSEPYCTFGKQGGACEPMPIDDDGATIDFSKLESGTYTIRVQVLYEGDSENWTTWRKLDDDNGNPLNYRRFVIPELPVYIEFVEDDSDDLLPDNRDITNRETMTRFRVKAFVGTDEEVANGTGTDGAGIEQIEFELIDMLGDPIDLNDADAQETSAFDTDLRYCMFGGNSPCNPMDADMFDRYMHSRTSYHDDAYIIRARAKTTQGSAGGGRWSDPVERTFEIPPVEMRFVDPDPDPSDSDSNYPNEPSDPYNTSGEKVIREFEQTAFEMEAFDPKYAGEDYDSDDEDQNYEDFSGLGITGYEFRLCGPDADDCERDDDIFDTLNLDTEHSYDEDDFANEKRLCALGRDKDDLDNDGNSNDCAPMDKGSFNSLARGTYTLKARAKNEIFERNGWTDWDEERWVELDFEIPAIYMDFTRVAPRIISQANTNFGFVVYDPTRGRTNGDIDAYKVELSLYGPVISGAVTTTLVHTQTIAVAQGVTIPLRDPEYCFFGPYNAATCEQMPLDMYKGLPAGSYYLEAKVHMNLAAGGQIFTHKENLFEIASAPFEMEFAQASRFTSTVYLHDADGITSTFEVNARRPASISNGTGVQQVWFEIRDNTGQKVDGVLPTQSDTAVPYCPFGESGGDCLPLGDTRRATLESLGAEYYVMRVRVQQIDADGGRWSSSIEQQFALP